MSDITLNTQSITGNHNFVPPGTDWNLGSGSKKWNGGYFGTIVADNGIPAGTAATGGDKIGQIRFSINPNIEPGYLALNGQEVNRTDYPNLWEWVQQQVGFLVEEGEWQSISAAHNGNVGKYSVGNGSTTFRLPNLGCWVRGANETGEIGEYLPAGSPEIEGVSNGGMSDSAYSRSTGAFNCSDDKNTEGLKLGLFASTTTSKTATINTFKASRSSSIYGNAETVQPESIVGIWLVKAYHVPVDNMGNTITVNGVPPDENGNVPNIARTDVANNFVTGQKFLKHPTVSGVGGQLFLEKPEVSTLAGDVVIDVMGEMLRFREKGGSGRGFNMNIASGAANCQSPIVTSVNGVKADYTGNIAIKISNGMGVTYSTTDLNAGISELPTGELYLVYE